MKLTHEEVKDMYIYLEFYKRDIPATEDDKERINHLTNILLKIIKMIPRKEIKP